jgi:hypothetical protein
MLTISISAAALASIAATLPKGSKAEARPEARAPIWSRSIATCSTDLRSLRGPGESYSDVILRLAPEMRR